MKLLKALEEDIEVVDVSKVGETAGGDQLGVLIVMSRAISLEIVLFQYILGVPIVYTTPMPQIISLTRSRSGNIV
jgi:hypothetical protein